MYRMKARADICPRAWLFGLFAAALLGLLGLPSLRLAGVRLSLEMAVVMTTINWILIVIYGACFGIGAAMFRTRQHVMVSINTFFYLSIWIVILKVFELPALGARFGALAQNCASLDYSSAVTEAIQKSHLTRVSDAVVGVGYLFFTLHMVRVTKELHDFGWMRAVANTLLAMVLLSAVVAFVQGPIIAQLVCSYSGKY